MLGDALEATPEPYLEIDAVPDYGPRETPPVVAPIAAPMVSPIVAPMVSPVLEPRPIIHLPSPAGSKKTADKAADDEARDADRRDKEAREAEAREAEARDKQAREAEARRAPVVEAEAAPERERKPRRAIPVAGKPVVLAPEESHSLLANYPPVSPVQRAISRFVTRVAVLAALGGGLYFARPYIVQRVPTWPWVVEHMVRPVDRWLRHLPLRFAPSRTRTVSDDHAQMSARASAGSTSPARAATRSAASASPRVGPRFTIATGTPRSVARRTKR